MLVSQDGGLQAIVDVTHRHGIQLLQNKVYGTYTPLLFLSLYIYTYIGTEGEGVKRGTIIAESTYQNKVRHRQAQRKKGGSRVHERLGGT